MGQEGKMKDIALQVAGVIFFLVAIVHLLRVMLKVEVIIGGYVFPMWFSILGFIVALALSLWMFKSLNIKK